MGHVEWGRTSPLGLNAYLFICLARGLVLIICNAGAVINLLQWLNRVYYLGGQTQQQLKWRRVRIRKIKCYRLVLADIQLIMATNDGNFSATTCRVWILNKSRLCLIPERNIRQLIPVLTISSIKTSKAPPYQHIVRLSVCHLPVHPQRSLCKIVHGSATTNKPPRSY